MLQIKSHPKRHTTHAPHRGEPAQNPFVRGCVRACAVSRLTLLDIDSSGSESASLGTLACCPRHVRKLRLTAVVSVVSPPGPPPQRTFGVM